MGFACIGYMSGCDVVHLALHVSLHVSLCVSLYVSLHVHVAQNKAHPVMCVGLVWVSSGSQRDHRGATQGH